MNWTHILWCLLIFGAGVVLAACEPYPEAAAEPGNGNLPMPVETREGDDEEPMQDMDVKQKVLLTESERKRANWDKRVGEDLGL